MPHYTKESVFKAMGIPYGLSIKKKTGTIRRKTNPLPDHIKVGMKNQDYKLLNNYMKRLPKSVPDNVRQSAKKQMMEYFSKNKYKKAREYYNNIIE